MYSGFTGLVLAFLIMVGCIILGGSAGFLNVPALQICILISMGLSIASSTPTDFGRAFRALRVLIVKPKLIDFTPRNAQVLRHMISYIYATGVVGTFIGLIQMSYASMDTSSVVRGLAASSITTFYAIIISEFILRVAVRRIEAGTEK